MPSPQEDNLRYVGYFLVAFAGLMTGIILGALGAQTAGGSRIEWPARSTLQSGPQSTKP